MHSPFSRISTNLLVQSTNIIQHYPAILTILTSLLTSLPSILVQLISEITTRHFGWISSLLNLCFQSNIFCCLFIYYYFVKHISFSHCQSINASFVILFTEKTRLVQSQGFKGKGRGWGRRVNPLIYTKKKPKLKSAHSNKNAIKNTQKNIFQFIYFLYVTQLLCSMFFSFKFALWIKICQILILQPSNKKMYV